MSEDLIILGAGGTSREIADTVGDINRREPRWNLTGFLDDDPAKQGTTVNGLPVLGPIASARNYAGRFIIGVNTVGDPWRRKRIFETVGLGRDRYSTIIHPSASVSSYAEVGAGTAILHQAVVTTNTVIGDHVMIQYHATIAHDDVIEDFVTMAPGSLLAGFVKLGAGAYIGAGSMIRNNLTVNEGAIVGIGAVVIRDVPANTTVAGNPARPLVASRQAAR
jgi:sugar O-acyltransferase (sialic acid O-acetyltransferase NeuD family)